MDFRLQALQAHDVFGLLGPKRIEHRLVLAWTCMDAAFHADARDQVLEAEARTGHRRSHDRTRIGDDLVGGAGEPVATRGGNILDEGDDGSPFSAACSRMRWAIRAD